MGEPLHRRVLVYSHDTFGLGNIRRMLAIATDLAGSLEQASILMLSGSPMVQGFRIAPGVDYIKLPSVTRTSSDGYATRSLGMTASDVFELRANLALAAVADFRPDVIVVDKKPYGVRNELEGALYYAKTHLPDTALVLIMRDILDLPAVTVSSWRRDGYSEAIERFYDRVLVLGTPDIFDFCHEYSLPPAVSNRLRYCGYIRRPLGARSRDEIRRTFGVADSDRLVLVTPGGGQDGHRVLMAYTDALPSVHSDPRVKSLIVTGPEMDAAHRERVARAASRVKGVMVLEFSDDMIGCMDAADLVVCMGGYNTLCEVATLRKRAIVVPRVRPVQEQWIRAERLAQAGVVARAIHPDGLDAVTLGGAVSDELHVGAHVPASLTMTALPQVTREVRALLQRQHRHEDRAHKVRVTPDTSRWMTLP